MIATVKIAALAVMLPLTVAGCSQVEGLAVSGNINVLYLSSAATDVLLDQGYHIGVKPVCEVTNTTQYSCSGSTADGQPISVVVPDSSLPQPNMTITVGGKQIFSGGVIEVIDNAAGAKGDTQ